MWVNDLLILNKGLNFSILPNKPNLNHALMDLAYHQRSMAWKEYWFDKEKQEFEKRVFKEKKTNMPPNSHKTPQGLRTYSTAIRSPQP